MRIANKIFFGVLVTGISIQFFVPPKNIQSATPNTDISKLFRMPEDVSGVLRNSCYDCHSNNTHYPWYAQIQPVAWYMARHIKYGKEDLNFNEFGNYSTRRQQSKLRAIANSMEDGSMPIAPYLWIHKGSRLSKDQKTLIIHWATATKDSLASAE